MEQVKDLPTFDVKAGIYIVMLNERNLTLNGKVLFAIYQSHLTLILVKCWKFETDECWIKNAVLSVKYKLFLIDILLYH